MTYPNQPQYQPLPPKPPKAKRTIPLWVFIVALVVTMFASCGVGAASAGGGSDETAVASSSGLTASDLDRREASLKQRDERLQQREAELAERESALDKRAAKLDKKEQKKAEQEAANTIPGEGVYVVGQDVEPGTYSTAGPSGGNPVGCYYAFKSGSGADADILDNNIINGRGTVTLEGGQVFETQGCQDWKRR